MTRPVDAIADNYVEEYAALDPVTATYLGIPGHEDRLPDLSPDGFRAREDLTRTSVAAARDAAPVDEREVVAREGFLERLGLDVEMSDAGLSRSDFSVISSGLHEIRQVFDMMSTGGEDDWSLIDARIAAVPQTLQDYRVTLAEEASKGNVSAARQYAEVAGQVRGWTGHDGADADFFTTLVESSGIGGTLRAQLDDHAKSASRAFAEFAMFLEDEMAPRGRTNEAVGRDHYALASRYFLGATVDLEQTYAWGWEELRRLTDEMMATADVIVPGSSIDEAVATLDADPARSIQGRAEFRQWMQELADRTLSEMADVHFDIPEPIRKIECCLAPTNDGGVYYTGPSEDFSRPGRMWWSVPDGINDFSPWREVTTVFHEGVPGHHLQVAQTTYRKELLNRWQRLMCWVSGHGEGWALYAERLMDDLGHLSDPADKLGMLDGQGFRAARVIVDIGMHLELEIPKDNTLGAGRSAFHPGERWTPALGLEFMRQHCRMDDPSIVFEVNRYLGWPGQAPSYKVGERIWLEARDEARARKGAAFDLKTFHRDALNLGSIGLDPLKSALARI
ncbi:MAG: DUF885 domain-containing protein [Nocardioides sp.]|nr:DUF885 domain-containing protein [Nocardioides sp.]